jgi:predicted molibdopterin-dependent oxidoreductase YjgC
MAAETNETFEFLFEGRRFTACIGQSVAAALIAVGERCLRLDEAGDARGAVCGIGFCWECRCEINGRPDVRACMTEAKPGMVVRRQRGSAVCRDR